MSDINLFTAAKAKKSLGQHFLHDERVVQRIVDLLRVEEGDQVVFVVAEEEDVIQNVFDKYILSLARDALEGLEDAE